MPRPPAEIQGERVKTATDVDVTKYFEQGAQLALELCLKHDIKIAVLKQGSPSCGNSLINDGLFSGQKIAGQGMTAQLLKANGIEVFNESEVSQLMKLNRLPKE